MPTLLLLRHAQAGEQAPTDAQRPLTSWGREQARQVAIGLANRELIPDVVLCSSAERTWQTWQTIEQELPLQPEVKVLTDLYQATPETVYQYVSQQHANVVLVVGHEPIMSTTAAMYAAEESDPAAVLSVGMGMPTANMAVIKLEDLTERAGVLTEVMRV